MIDFHDNIGINSSSMRDLLLSVFALKGMKVGNIMA